MPQQDDTQLELFRQAVDALGGQAAFARALDFSTRHAGRLYSGANPISEGILGDTAAALLAHSSLCRKLSSQLVPIGDNLTEDQRAFRDSGKRPTGRPRGS